MRHEAASAASVRSEHRSFTETPGSPSAARAFVRGVLSSWELTPAEDVLVLLVSELATNVVLHARTGFDVVLEVRDDVVRLSVLDDSPAGPVRRSSALRSATGRGLALVETLSVDWGRTPGAELGGRAKGVWCEVLTEPATELAEGAMYGGDWLALLEDPAEV